MKNITRILPTLIIPIITSFVTNAGILLLAAILIEAGILHIDSSQIICVLSIVVSSLMGSFLTVKKCGIKFFGFIYSAVYLFILSMSCFINNGTDGLASASVRYCISIFAGTILGNLLGSKTYYRLRNSGKKRFQTTK